jgi:hypothetical protein
MKRYEAPNLLISLVNIQYEPPLLSLLAWYTTFPPNPHPNELALEPGRCGRDAKSNSPSSTIAVDAMAFSRISEML